VWSVCLTKEKKIKQETKNERKGDKQEREKTKKWKSRKRRKNKETNGKKNTSRIYRKRKNLTEVEDEPIMLLPISSMVYKRNPILTYLQTSISSYVLGMLNDFHGFTNSTLEKVIFFCHDISVF
jgi:hypothetical protein